MSKNIELRNLFLNDFSPQEQYRKLEESQRTTIHYGQLKLMMTDIMFLSIFWDPKKVPRPQVVIVGAAPGQHYPIFVKMFPEITFHLYDPRKFDIPQESRERIRLYKQYFTDDDAHIWSGRNDVIFISDIRSIEEDTAKEKYEERVEFDMKIQQDWVEIMDPVVSSLKFRLKYPAKNPVTGLDDIDVISEYLDGFRMKQIWQPHVSTEVRLIPIKVNGKYRRKKWSSLLHQNQCYFHNVRIRTSNFYNPFTNDMTPIFEDELTNDFDSVSTALILKKYLHRMTGNIPTLEDTVALYRVILEDINNHRRSILTVAQLRQSERKSSIYRDAEEKDWARKQLPKFIYKYKPFISVLIGNESTRAPLPIELLR